MPNNLDDFLKEEGIDTNKEEKGGFEFYIKAKDKNSQQTAREIFKNLHGGSKEGGTRRKSLLLIAIVAILYEGSAQFAKTPHGKERFATNLGYEPISIIDEFSRTRNENIPAIRAEFQNNTTVNEFIVNTTGVGVIDGGAGNNILPEVDDAYYKKRAHVAISEARFGICPSIKLAQSRIESGSGTSRLARDGNNHHGMKMGTYYTIKKAGNGLREYIKHAPKNDQPYLQMLIEHVQFVEENFNGSGNYRDDKPGEAFVHFKKPEASFAAHTLLLLFGMKNVDSQNKNVISVQGRYLPILSSGNYQGQAAGIKIAGYATEEEYHLYCIKGIEKSGIDKLDKYVNWSTARQLEKVIMSYFEWLSKK